MIRRRFSPGYLRVAVLVLAAWVGMTGCDGPDSRQWDEIDDYSFTLEHFERDCGGRSEGAWSITVKNGESAGVEALNKAARELTWAEGPPTLKELHENAVAVKKDGAYDVVRIDYETGDYGRRPAGVYYLDRDRGEESCKTYTDYRPLTSSG